MILTSPLYDRDPNNQYGDFTYKWSDPNTDADHFQSFASTGRGLIDQSIFPIIRYRDIYSLGENMTFFYNAVGETTSPSTPTYEVVHNNLRKNLDCLCASPSFNQLMWRATGTSSDNNTPLLYNAKYSPDGIYNVSYSQCFAREWSYNDIVLYPYFALIYNNNGTINIPTCSYNEMMEYASSYQVYVRGLYLTPYFGDINEGTLERSVFMNIGPYCQFAGTIPKLKCTYHNTYYANLYNKVISKIGTDSGVYEFGIGSGSTWYLFATPLFVPGTKYYRSAITDLNNNNIMPYDISLFEEVIWADTSVRLFATTPDAATKMVDRLGYNWAKSQDAALHAKTGSHCDNPDIRCAIIDPETNTITPDVLEGENIAYYAAEVPESNYNWGTGAVDYNGSTIADIRTATEPEQPTLEPVDEIDLNEPTMATTGGTSMWIMSELDLQMFFKVLWNPDGSRFDDFVKGCALCGENPMDSIISLRLYPLNLQQRCTYETKTVCFGRTNMGEELRDKFHVTSSNIIVINLGTFNFNDFGMYKDFRDYEPYSDYAVYIPFCGIIPLSAIECVNTTISIKMIIDLCTGSCTGVLFTNNVPYKYLDGMIGIDVPVTGRNLAGYANTVLAAALGGGTVATRSPMAKKSIAGANEWGAAQKSTARLNLSQFSENMYTGAFASEASETAMLGATGAGGMALGAAAPVAMGLAFGIAGAAIGGAAAALTSSPAVESVGSNTPATALAKPLKPYLIVRRSDSWIPAHYDQLYGRPCQQGGTISDFVGFCTFGNIKIESISYATSEEKVLISELLTKGVFL